MLMGSGSGLQYSSIQTEIMRYFLLVTALIITSNLAGQSTHESEPFIIRGRITDCPVKFFKIYFYDSNSQELVDTIFLSESGEFYLETYKVQFPQQVNMQSKSIQINQLLVAPGYHLTITANGENNYMLQTSKKISGTGSASNHYRFMLDSIGFARNKPVEWYNMKEDDLLIYMKTIEHLEDSVVKLTFDLPADNDKYFEFFRSMVLLDNKFKKLSKLLTYVYWQFYGYDKSVSFVRNHFENLILDKFNNENYLISPKYRSLVTNEWLEYLVNLDLEKNPALKMDEGYKFKKIVEVYTGKVKHMALLGVLQSKIMFCKSMEEFNSCVNLYNLYSAEIDNQDYKKVLTAKMVEKKMELLRIQTGQPVPNFVLHSNTGTRHSLGDFKNKVVYIDLWASWCGPCREEIPAFKELYNRFKNDDRIAFVSIGVLDEEAKWKKAIMEDKPGWLQLFDSEGVVTKSFFVNMVPQFIIIDKKGNILEFDAPPPSSGKKIEDLLNEAISK